MNNNIPTSIGLAYTITLCDSLSHKKILNCVFKSIIKNRAGFTLAETLITLTIIGVIAAMTIPNLLSNYTKHTYVVGLKKAYSQLQNVMRMMPMTEGCANGDYSCLGILDGKLTTKELTTLLSRQFKTSKLSLNASEYSNDEGCRSVGRIYGGGYQPCFYTDDGMIYTASGGFSNIISVDVNGLKGPNKRGRDQFAFNIVTSGNLVGTVRPYRFLNTEEKSWDELCTTEAVNTQSTRYDSGLPGVQCAGRVLDENAMNY